MFWSRGSRLVLLLLHFKDIVMARLFIVKVDNHPFAKRNTFWELKEGFVQQIKMTQQKSGHATPDGYIGIIYPFNKISDAVVEVRE